jgi:hypothetical protein
MAQINVGTQEKPMFQPAPNFVQSIDKTLESRVASQLLARDAAVLPPLQVTADRGTVTLRGEVDSHVTRRKIVAIVRQVSGVRRVIDEIEIVETGHQDSWKWSRYQFSPALVRFFEERRQGLVSRSALAWDS